MLAIVQDFCSLTRRAELVMWKWRFEIAEHRNDVPFTNFTKEALTQRLKIDTTSVTCAPLSRYHLHFHEDMMLLSVLTLQCKEAEEPFALPFSYERQNITEELAIFLN